MWACRSQHSCIRPEAAAALRRCQNPTRLGLPWLWLFATSEVSRPHRQWPCGSLWLQAPHRLIGRAGDVACSCLVSVDLSVSTLGALLRGSTNSRCLSLPVTKHCIVHLLTRIVGSARRNLFTRRFSIAGATWAGLLQFCCCLVGEHPSACGGERFASAHHSCCITHVQSQLLGRTCNALWCVAEACSARNTVSVTCCPRMPQQERRSYAQFKGAHGWAAGRHASSQRMRLHDAHACLAFVARIRSICSTVATSGGGRLQYKIPVLSSRVTRKASGGDACDFAAWGSRFCAHQHVRRSTLDVGLIGHLDHCSYAPCLRNLLFEVTLYSFRALQVARIRQHAALMPSSAMKQR